MQYRWTGNRANISFQTSWFKWALIKMRSSIIAIKQASLQRHIQNVHHTKMAQIFSASYFSGRENGKKIDGWFIQEKLVVPSKTECPSYLFTENTFNGIYRRFIRFTHLYTLAHSSARPREPKPRSRKREVAGPCQGRWWRESLRWAGRGKARNEKALFRDRFRPVARSQGCDDRWRALPTAKRTYGRNA